MAKKEQETSYTIISALENFEVSYSLYSKGNYNDDLLKDWVNITSKVIYSENKNIKKNDILCFKMFIEKSYEDYKELPNWIGIFDRSKKMRSCYITVPPMFIDRFSLILNQKKNVYFPLSCTTDKDKGILVKTFNMESEVNIEEYVTCGNEKLFKKGGY